MTEEEWLNCPNQDSIVFWPDEVVASQRKLRLFCCACVRRIRDRFDNTPLTRQSVEVAESFADGEASVEKLYEWYQRTAIEQSTGSETIELQHGDDFRGAQDNAFRAAGRCIAIEMDVKGVARFVSWAVTYASDKSDEVEQTAHRALLRDIFGNPFRPVAFDPAWRTEAAVGIAAKVYDDRDFAAMPILADALQDAGCEDEQVLSHCREPGTHVRGCWVVDLVLKKE